MNPLLPGKYTIPVVTRLQDNGDGGYTMYIYNNFNELLADHPNASDGELTEEQKTEILSEDDPYENGYIGKDNIEIEVTVDGRILLAEPMSFHSGQ